jgi:hypothetical protein
MKRRLTRSQTVDLPWEFDVVGEHRSDPSRILMRGADSQYYELHVGDGHVSKVEPDSDWITDTFVVALGRGRSSYLPGGFNESRTRHHAAGINQRRGNLVHNIQDRIGDAGRR